MISTISNKLSIHISYHYDHWIIPRAFSTALHILSVLNNNRWMNDRASSYYAHTQQKTETQSSYVASWGSHFWQMLNLGFEPGLLESKPLAFFTTSSCRFSNTYKHDNLLQRWHGVIEKFTALFQISMGLLKIRRPPIKIRKQNASNLFQNIFTRWLSTLQLRGIFFFSNESVLKRKIPQLKQWLSNSWLGALLAIN